MASNSNYYQFREAKVVIALELMKRGWKIFGYSPMESDPYTDYYSPAYWDGIATYNGYVLVVDDNTARNSGRQIKQYVSGDFIELSEKARKTIDKLKEIRQDRGATESEENTAKEKIRIIMAKMEGEKKSGYQVVDVYPTYQKNPGRSSWHVEKDGVIIDKGNGIGKFSALHWFDKEKCERDIKCSSTDSYTFQRATEQLETYKNLSKWLERIDSAAGKRIGGNGKAYTMEVVNTVEYKHKNVVVPADGSLRDGQLFEVVSSFNYGVSKGYVYKIHENEGVNGKKWYIAYRMNKNLTKELTGMANRANSWWIDEAKFNKWIEKGALRYVKLADKVEPVTVQKVVKKPAKTA